MRVSMYSKFNMNMYHMNNIQNKSVTQQYQVATGMKFQKVSDDPISANQSLIIEKASKRLEQYQLNIRDLKGSVSLVESALAQSVEIMQSVRETALQAANGTTSANDKATFSLKVENNMQQIMALANQKYLGKYLFSGEMTKTEPFSMVGTSAVYNGNAASATVKISPYLDMNMTENGQAVFQNTFAALENLKVQISSGTSATIQAAVNQLDAAMEEVVNKRSVVGINMESLEMVEDNFATQLTELTVKKSNTDEVDFAKIASEYANTSRIQQSLMAVTVKMFDNSLLKYL